MSEHLTRERIAALVDEPEGSEARAHVDSCEACAREFERMSRLRMALSGLAELDPPDGEWERIEAALPAAPGAGWRGGRLAGSRFLRAAAIVVLFLGGLLIGQRIGMPGEGGPAAPVAADTSAGPDGAEADDRYADDRYLRTVARLEALRERAPEIEEDDWTEDPEAVAERIAHLDALIDASREALEKAPTDPVLNNFLFDVVDERDRLAGELDSALRMATLEYR